MVIVVMFTNLANYGAPSCRQSMDWLVNDRRKRPLGFYAVQGEARQLQVCRKKTLMIVIAPINQHVHHGGFL